MNIADRRDVVLRTFAADTASLKDASILITGGTGSFGRHMVRFLLDSGLPRRIILFSRDELKQYEISNEFQKHPNFALLRFFIGDVRDRQRLQMAFRGVEYVIHAAALKQVTTAEYNPFECIHTNVLGAENIVQAALSTNIKKVIALSTDKAASPVNLYGASKLASDKIFVAANNMAGGSGPLFAVVRYGNVIGSRGSVVPYFRQLVRENAAALPITDPRMTRFWITLDQGVNFVLSCIDRMKGGEIFIPKIPSTSIVDLAQAIAPAMPHKVVGIRPGEKLHEVMITTDDARSTVELQDCYIIKPSFPFWNRELAADPAETPVPEDFCYSSDLNPEKLSLGQLKALLEA